jgi:UDP-hydrolysing UDP-N-acetyl-D-glucosamine 2-epimerase
VRTVCVVITARPSYARVRTVLDAIETHGDLELTTVLAGSALLKRYGSVVEDVSRQHHIGCEMYTHIEGESHAAMVHSASNLATQLATFLEAVEPHIVVSIADRHETLGTALAASYMNIPLAHVQGGEVTGSIDDKVRNAVTQLADLHFTATDRAAARVADMKHSWDGIWSVGCPSIDIAKRVKDHYTHRFNPFEKYGGVGPKFDLDEPYVVVLQHPVTTHADTSRADMLATLMAVKELGTPAFIFWPNADTGTDAISKLLREFREQQHLPWHFFRHLDAEDFLRLLLGSLCLIGNSSVGIRECSFLAVPVVNVGDRQKGRERARNVRDTSADHKAIVEAVRQHARAGAPSPSSLYGDGDAGEQIAKLLAECPL